MTKFIFLNQRVFLMGITCSLLLLSACATTKSTESPLEVRAMERWDTLLSGDLAGAYEYLSPGYRSSVSSLQYQRTLLLQRVRWTSAAYVGDECEEGNCKVKVSLGYSIYGVLPGVKSFKGTQEIEESWVLVKNNWYLVPGQ